MFGWEIECKQTNKPDTNRIISQSLITENRIRMYKSNLNSQFSINHSIIVFEN